MLRLSPCGRLDCLQAHNGSGKTTCFTLAMLSRVDENIQQTQALCVCPTRELVVQNLEVLQKMGRHTQIHATSTARVESAGARSAGLQVLLHCKRMQGSHGVRHSIVCAEIRRSQSRLSLALMASSGNGLENAR